MKGVDPKAAHRLLSDDATFATTALVIALKSFGAEALQQDVLELILDLEEEFKVELSEKVSERLQAIQLATTTDAFYEDVTAFRAIANTLLDGDPGFDAFDDVSIIEILWAIYEVEMHHEKIDFTRPVAHIIQVEIENDGEEVTELDEAMGSSYHQNIMRELRVDLVAQLGQIGVPEGDVPEVKF